MIVIDVLAKELVGKKVNRHNRNRKMVVSVIEEVTVYSVYKRCSECNKEQYDSTDELRITFDDGDCETFTPNTYLDFVE